MPLALWLKLPDPTGQDELDELPVDRRTGILPMKWMPLSPSMTEVTELDKWPARPHRLPRAHIHRRMIVLERGVAELKKVSIVFPLERSSSEGEPRMHLSMRQLQ
jgi:hypothetical protein